MRAKGVYYVWLHYSNCGAERDEDHKQLWKLWEEHQSVVQALASDPRLNAQGNIFAAMQVMKHRLSFLEWLRASFDLPADKPRLATVRAGLLLEMEAWSQLLDSSPQVLAQAKILRPLLDAALESDDQTPQGKRTLLMVLGFIGEQLVQWHYHQAHLCT